MAQVAQGAESPETPKNIVILGAGVVGLTIAAILGLRFSGNKEVKVTVVGQSTPKEPQHDKYYTSPKAGANWHSFAGANELTQQEYDGTTFRVLYGLFGKHTDTTHVQRMPSLELRRPKGPDSVIGATNAPLEGEEIDEKTGLRLPWFRHLTPGFRIMEKEELERHGAEAGYTYDTLTLDAPAYLKFLQDLVEKLGGTIKSIPRLNHVDELLSGHSALSGNVPDVLFLCPGIGARHLGGVEDKDVYPTRGQVVVVKAPQVNATSGFLGEWAYAIPRGGKDGHVILGGTYQVDDWNVEPDDETTERIVKVATKLPTLPDQPGIQASEVLWSHAGLRPTRHGGIRIDAYDSGKTRVVTAYGHGGYGFQSSWGSCLAAVNKFVEGSGREKVSEQEILEKLEKMLENW